MPTHAVHAIERPHPNLMKLYLLRSMLSGPFIVVLLPLLFFRYHTLRYRFDDEGVSMAWGLLFRREVNLTYARIQDIHLTSGPLQRWLSLADLHVQTASGSAAAEMVIEGVLEFEDLRDYLYERMRGAKDPSTPSPGAGATGGPELSAALESVRREVAGARAALESLARGGGSDA